GCTSETDTNEENSNTENNEQTNGENNEKGDFPRTIEVDGQSLTIEKKPENILPLSLDAAEIVLELVEPSRVTATTEGIDNPNLSTQADIVSQIEDKIPSEAAVNIDPEQMLSYDTDLFILTQSQGEDEEAIEVLKEQDIPVL